MATGSLLANTSWRQEGERECEGKREEREECGRKATTQRGKEVRERKSKGKRYIAGGR